tara:strand:+ start:589 stop:951 length:363 start_codon:yes stop_codon:yes gene_type:complete
LTVIQPKRVEADGYKFDSQSEYTYYVTLKLKQAAKVIRDLEVHPKVKLTKHISWKLDFKFFDVEKDCIVYVDIKGRRKLPPDIPLKVKLWREFATEMLILVLHKGRGSYEEIRTVIPDGT